MECEDTIIVSDMCYKDEEKPIICVLRYMQLILLMDTVHKTLRWVSLRWCTDEGVGHSLGRGTGLLEQEGLNVENIWNVLS